MARYSRKMFIILWLLHCSWGAMPFAAYLYETMLTRSYYGKPFFALVGALLDVVTFKKYEIQIMTTRIFKAVFFDMDGVLIQSRELVEWAWSSVAYSYGIEVNQSFIHEHVHGRPGDYTLRMLFADFDSVQRSFIKKQVDAAEENGTCLLVPGVETLISKLLKEEVPLALVTSSWPKRIEHVLRQHGLGSAFDCVVSREDVSSGKPAPDCYLLAAQRLNQPIHECLVFEDSLSGVQSAVRSGALCLGIGHDRSLVAAGAAARYTDFDALSVAHVQTHGHVFDGHGLGLGAHDFP